MNYRLFGLILFISWSSLLLTVASAQARQFAPSLYAHKSAIRRIAGRLSGRRNRTFIGRARYFYPAPTPSQINELVAGTANQLQVDPQLVAAIIQVESGYNTNAVSRRGARGLMQLIPETARRFGVKNPFDPIQNIAGGVAYLKQLLHIFSGDVLLSVAAYNAGEHAVLRLGGIPPYPETVEYVRRVATLYRPALLAGMVTPAATKSAG